MKITTQRLSAACVLILGLEVAQAQAPAAPAFDFAKMRAEVDAFNKKPDTVGTGKYPALKEMVDSLPNHVIYRPADLSKLGNEKLGVLAWGNGGCAADGAGGRFHLAEIASHGYLAIASGTIQSGPGAPPKPAGDTPPGPPALGANGMPLHIPPPATKAALLTEGIDWALAENQRKGSPYYGRINPQWIAVSGWSCGGLQALEVAADPRVRTVIIHSSGIFADANPIPASRSPRRHCKSCTRRSSIFSADRATSPTPMAWMISNASVQCRYSSPTSMSGMAVLSWNPM